MATAKPLLMPLDTDRMEAAGDRLKKTRERLGLTYRDVEQASLSIAQRRNNDEFIIALSRLADIENKGVVPTIYRLYSLCTIYRLDPLEVMAWYGADPAGIAADSIHLPAERTHMVRFANSGYGSVSLPLSLDPGIDLKRTTFLSRMIQRWGSLPLMLLQGMDPASRAYGYVGAEDWSMYPLLHPGSLVMVDLDANKPVEEGWTSELERPIYLVENASGYAVGWLNVVHGVAIVQPHPESGMPPALYRIPGELKVIGQVVGVAMTLYPPRKGRTRS